MNEAFNSSNVGITLVAQLQKTVLLQSNASPHRCLTITGCGQKQADLLIQTLVTVL